MGSVFSHATDPFKGFSPENTFKLQPLPTQPAKTTPTLTDAVDKLAAAKQQATLLTGGSRRSTMLTAGSPIWPPDGKLTPSTGKDSTPTVPPPPGTKLGG